METIKAQGYKKRFIDRHFTLIMCLPLIVISAAILAFPIGLAIQTSFTEWNLATGAVKKFAGLSNYIKLFRDYRFWNSVYVTLYFTGGAISISVVGGILLAQLLHKRFPGRKLVIGCLLLPMMASPIATAMIWKVMYDPTMGVLNFLLELFNLPPSVWASSSRTVIPSLILYDVWMGIPFVMIIVLAGFSMLPSEPFEAAQVDGASPFQTFWHITLPLLRPAIMVAFILRLIVVLKVFASIYAISGGGPGYSSETMYMYTYKQAFSYGNMGYSSSLGIVLFVIVATATFIFMRVLRKPK